MARPTEASGAYPFFFPFLSFLECPFPRSDQLADSVVGLMWFPLGFPRSWAHKRMKTSYLPYRPSALSSPFPPPPLARKHKRASATHLSRTPLFSLLKNSRQIANFASSCLFIFLLPISSGTWRCSPLFFPPPLLPAHTE